MKSGKVCCSVESYAVKRRVRVTRVHLALHCIGVFCILSTVESRNTLQHVACRPQLLYDGYTVLLVLLLLLVLLSINQSATHQPTVQRCRCSQYNRQYGTPPFTGANDMQTRLL